MYAIMTNENDIVVVEASEVKDYERFGYSRASDRDYKSDEQAFKEAVLLHDSE